MPHHRDRSSLGRDQTEGHGGGDQHAQGEVRAGGREADSILQESPEELREGVRLREGCHEGVRTVQEDGVQGYCGCFRRVHPRPCGNPSSRASPQGRNGHPPFRQVGCRRQVEGRRREGGESAPSRRVHHAPEQCTDIRIRPGHRPIGREVGPSVLQRMEGLRIVQDGQEADTRRKTVHEGCGKGGCSDHDDTHLGPCESRDTASPESQSRGSGG